MLVPTEGPIGAKIFFVGEAPGEEEDRVGKPFRGRAGRTLDSLLLQAGIMRQECRVGNVAKERPLGNDISRFFEDKKKTIPKPQLVEWIEELRKEILTEKPNIVVALGDTALWALTGSHGIKARRGAICESRLVPGQKVLPTYHPQAVGYEWGLAFEVIMDLRKAVRHSETPDIPKDNRSLATEPSKDFWIEYCYRMAEAKCPIAIDIESTQPGSHITRIGLSHSADYAISIPFVKGRNAVHTLNNEVAIYEALGQLMTNCPLIFHNGAYDSSVIVKNHGLFSVKILFDTIIAAHVLFPESPRDLGFLASILLDVPAWKYAAKDDPGLYNAADVCNTFALYEVMDKLLDSKGVRKIFNHEMRQIPLVSMLGLQGLDVDLSYQKKFLDETNKSLNEVVARLDAATGGGINYNSPDQIKSLLYVTNSLPIQFKRRKSKEEEQKVTTDIEALEKLSRATDSPIVKDLIEHRKYSKRLSSFADITVSPEGKVFTSYNITGKKDIEFVSEGSRISTKSFGRWSSSQSIIDPYGPGNLQNVPEIARVLYRTKPGYKFLSADYVQAEAVDVAYLCHDTVLMKMFEESFGMSASERKKAHDVHKYTASIMYEIPMEDVTPEQRRIGKTIRHACNYNAGPMVVAARVGVMLNQAKRLRDMYYAKNPLLLAWYQRIQNKLRQDRTLTNPFGRIHKFTERWGDELFRSAYAYEPQSTVGDLMNKSLTDIYEKYGDELIISLQLHDAGYFLVEESKIDYWIPLIREAMLFPLEVGMSTATIDVDFKVGPSWGEMEELDISWK